MDQSSQKAAPAAGAHQPEGSFTSGIFKLVASRGLSLVIALGSAPVVARLFSPADFGIYGVVTAVGTWLASFACLSYFQAIPLASGRGEIRALIHLCLLLTLALFGISLVIPWAGADLLSRWLESPSARPFLWFAPFLFLLNSLASVAENTLSREQRFGSLALFNFATTNFTRLFTIAWGLAIGTGALGLIVCNLAGLAAALVIAGIALRPILAGDAAPACTMLQAARRHKKFPKVQMWNWVLDATSQSFPVLILGAYFNPAVVGLFVYARNIILMPRVLLSASVSQVFYPQGAREWEENQTLANSLARAMKIMTSTAVFPCLIIGLLAPVLFELAFGARWREAGVYAQILSPWMFTAIISAPVSLVLLVTNRAHLALRYNMAMLGVRVGGLALGGWLEGPRMALFFFSLGSAVVLAHQTCYCLRVGGAGLERPLKLLGAELLRSGAAAAPAAILYWMGGPGWAVLGLAALGGGLHYLLLIRREEVVRRELGRLWGRK